MGIKIIAVITGLLCCTMQSTAQQKLLLGARLGPARAITENFNRNGQSAYFDYNVKTTYSGGLFLEYVARENLSIEASFEETSYSFGYSLSDLLVSTDSLGGSTQASYGYSYGYYRKLLSISGQFNLPLTQSKRVVLRQSLGLSLMPALADFSGQKVTYGQDSTLTPWRVYSTLVPYNNFNYGFTTRLGLQFTGKRQKNYLTLDMAYLHGFRLHEYWDIVYYIEGQKYQAGIASKGDYLSFQLGYKVGLGFLSKKK